MATRAEIAEESVDAMNAGADIDPDAFLHEQLAHVSPDLMREMLATFINSLLSAQADTVCG